VKTLVIGAGSAGLWCALHAVERGPTTLLAPDPVGASSTALAQGGIAAAVEEGDEPAAHAADTIAAGAGLCDPEAVGVLTEEAPAAIAEVRSRGMVFDQGGAPTLEGGHGARRVLHAGGDATGWALLRTLVEAVSVEPRIEWTRGRAARLLVDGGRVVGAMMESGQEVTADRVVLATGGATGIFGRRTGPERATGHGMALAWDAGAALADLEFVQFHPTALDVPGHPARLLTEALRGEGAVLLDAGGHRFMDRYSSQAELAPRDVVARAIFAVRVETAGPVFLDATGIPDVRQRFPTAAASCDEAGLDIAHDPIPVAPAAHYFTGGVLTDTSGRSTVPGLLAAGECANTGVHGANRLASNSLLETLVFGRRAALAEDVPGPGIEPTESIAGEPPYIGLAIDEVRAVADLHLGVVRSAVGLRTVEAALVAPLPASRVIEPDRPATLVAWLLAEAALRREESRGGHYRRDFPEARPEWRVRQVVSRDGWIRLRVDGSIAAR
jgi:L-aspartate oxidase